MFEIGSTLREARVRRKLTLQQVEEDTKIRVKYVQAMENEDFDVIPSPTYVKGFLRTYCVYLGLDPQMVLDEYRSRFMPDDEMGPFAGASALGKPRNRRRHSNLAFIAVAALLVLALVYILGIGQRHEGSNPATPAIGATPGTSLSPTTTATPGASPSATAKVFSGTLLRVSAAGGPCWVEVRRDGSSGALLFMDTIAQGQSKLFKAKGKLFVRLGDPGVVRVTLGEGAAHKLAETLPSSYLVTSDKMVRQ